MRYHERTKHHFYRFAAGPGGLDWANQPDPFRRYAGAPLTRLPILGPGEEPVSPAYESLYARGAVPSAPLNQPDPFRRYAGAALTRLPIVVHRVVEEAAVAGFRPTAPE